MLEAIRRINQTASFNRWLDLQVTSVGNGEAEIRLDWRPDDFGQYAGFLHAGLIAAMLDTSCGYAAATVAGKVMASHFSVNCLAPGVGDFFVARGKVVKAGRKQVFASAELFAMQGEAAEPRLIATGNAILVPVDDPARAAGA
jgi:uncharacterized protein (TIGR00369 family)